MSNSVNKLLYFSIFAVLAIASFLIIRPFLAAIFTALLLAFVFRPLHLKINRYIKSPTIVALIVSLMVILLLVILTITILQISVKQVVEFYSYTQTSDILAPIKALLVKYSDIDPQNFAFIFDTILKNITSVVVNSINTVILEIPFLALQFVVTFFVMFYFIRDGDIILDYLKSVIPFKESTKDRLIQRFKEITYAVIYGSIFVGIIQGLAAGIGYWIFGVEGAFVLTLMSIVLSILPLGSWILWIPASISLINSGETANGIGLLVYGAVFVSYIDNILRSYFISQKTKLSPVTAVLGMLGGVFLFGVVGLFVGPIILDYLIIFIEFFKKGNTELI